MLLTASTLRRVAARITPVIIAALAAVALAACGSSKPAYCSSRSNLENSIKGLTSLSVSSGLSGLQSQVQKIHSDATTLVDKAKGDFPNETSAISSSVNSLESAVRSLSSSPSAGQIAAVASAASGVVSSVRTFVDTTRSKCG